MAFDTAGVGFWEGGMHFFFPRSVSACVPEAFALSTSLFFCSDKDFFFDVGLYGKGG